MSRYQDILSLFQKHGQEHVLAGYDKLFSEQKDQLLDDCERVDFDWLAARWAEFGAEQGRRGSPPEHAPRRCRRTA